jgi:hypothetical protein
MGSSVFGRFGVKQIDQRSPRDFVASLGDQVEKKRTRRWRRWRDARRPDIDGDAADRVQMHHLATFLGE